MNLRKQDIFSATVAASGLILAPSWVWAQEQSEPYRHWHGPHMMDWGGGGYGMIFGPLFMILVLAGTIAIAVLLVSWLSGPWHGAHSPRHMRSGHTPLDILKERYARGEIDKEEFEERRRVLGD